jgi:lysophospholipase L1-like esterase
LFFPAVASQGSEKGCPTLFIAGDSTAAEFRGVNPRGGWGEFLGSYFDAQRLKVVNATRGGRSSRTFVSEGHWENLLAQVHAGDFILIQFGHNDDGGMP